MNFNRQQIEFLKDMESNRKRCPKDDPPPDTFPPTNVTLKIKGFFCPFRWYDEFLNEPTLNVTGKANVEHFDWLCAMLDGQKSKKDLTVQCELSVGLGVEQKCIYTDRGFKGPTNIQS